MDNIQTLDQLKCKYYGEIGTPERDRLENELEALRIGYKIRTAPRALTPHRSNWLNALTKNVRSYPESKMTARI